MLAKTIEQRKNPGCTVEVSVGRWFTRITTHAHVRGQAGGGHKASKIGQNRTIAINRNHLGFLR
jgi:hypothetical protein